jgi:hypothetical protein
MGNFTFFLAYFLLYLLGTGTGLSLVFAQQNSDYQLISYTPETPGCIYYANEFRGRFSVPAPQDVQARMGTETPCSTIIVNYNGFTPQAEAAFQYAVDLWALSVESTQVITVDATFEALAQGTLGSAGSGFIPLNPGTVPGAVGNTFYPIPLAEKMANTNFNGSNFDIVARFNSTVNWYFGTDANPPSGQFDFVTVVLHELGHGMGFIGFGDVINGSEGTVRLGNPPRPSIFDTFIENVGNQSIISFPDPSLVLGLQLTSGNLFCNSPNAIIGTGGIRPETYAPPVFDLGSSYSHWDEIVFPSGGLNSLMTPFLGPGEAIHFIGDNTVGFLEDMGWTICAALSNEAFTATSVKVSPNPFSTELIIRLRGDRPTEYQIKLIDLNGRLVIADKRSASNGEIKLTNLVVLDDSIYFLEVKDVVSGNTVTTKLIKH